MSARRQADGLPAMDQVKRCSKDIAQIAETTNILALNATIEAMRAGALGYVLKEAADSELVEAVRLAAQGKEYLHPQLGARLAAEPEGADALPDDLTEREVEVLRLIALGHTNTEIAEQLYLSVRTVESHRAHIQQKLRVSSRAELVRYALDRKLVEP
ncbi:hypothetical protein LCGC14_1886550 [marine sediment metagenome]|uniref:HTH luxR-type domain-containing protein n=1 Tax=marine sediment metagenome TaxID=412755 RepID=A0A0F9IEP6_9ZZZZ